MTTHTRQGFKARKADFERKLVRLAHALAPREGFFVEPLYRETYGRDPEGERPPHEAWLFVIDGSEDELEAFDRELVREALRLTESDRQLRNSIDVGAIPLSERPDCLLRRFNF